MNTLKGIRIHLSGSIPQDATTTQADGIRDFVSLLAKEALRRGGGLLHGSHPTLIPPLEAAGVAYGRAGGRRDALTLVRAQAFSTTEEQRAEIESQREWASVEIIPSTSGDTNDSLVPMREWMAERSDVIVAVGGKWYDTNPERAGIPKELSEMILRGKPAFLAAGFCGATAGYLNDKSQLLEELRNGWDAETNRRWSTQADPSALAKAILDQIQFLPLNRRAVSGTRLFRILALDGGGLRGTFTAAVLAKWSDMLGEAAGAKLAKHFDLIAGTSTGAILAIGLGMGLSPSEMLGFYRTKGPQIFPKDRWLRHWLKSKHDAGTLRDVLTSVFEERKLSDSVCRLVIPTVRARNGKAEVIVTPHHANRTAFRNYSAVEAALCSAAAPTYFDEADVHDGTANQEYLDGGIWANNPILPGLVEAVRHLEIPLDRIDVLSVGTLANEPDFSESLKKGKAGWGPSSASLFFAAQESGALILADALLTPSRHLRVNQWTSHEIKLDDTSAIEDMATFGSNAAKDTFDAVHSRFLDGLHATDWHADTQFINQRG